MNNISLSSAVAMSDVDKSARIRATQLKDGTNTRRTGLVRQDSDHLLSYYESSIPNESSHYVRPAKHRIRKRSTDSSSSAYSNNEAEPQEPGSESSASVTKRLGTPSKGSADRRRLAIVQVDTLSDGARRALHSSSSSAASTIRERRGYNNDLAGLALVAPPDAAVHSYTHLTPPPTAPLPADNSNRVQRTAVQAGHHRAASDIAAKPFHSRNPQDRRMTDNDDAASPSPAPPPSDTLRSTAADHRPVGESFLSAQDGVYQDQTDPSLIRTPRLGEGKEIHVPVAAPVVVNLEQSAQPRSGNLPPRSSSPAASSVSGHGHGSRGTPAYHVFGGHPTSGHPRPPRPHTSAQETVSDIHHIRSPAFGVSATKSPSMSDIRGITEAGSAERGQESIHRREGATTKKEPSVIESSSPNSLSFNMSRKALAGRLLTEEATPKQSDQRDLPPTPTVEPPTPQDSSPHKMDHSKFDQWLNQNPQFETQQRGASLDEPHRRSSHSPLSADHHHHHHHHHTLPVEPPEAPKGFKHNLATNLKRFSSLSRGPSLSSKSRSSQETRRSPSPRSHYFNPKPRPQFQKVVSMNPAALFCHEVDGQNTTLQRCMIYANKINELYMYDCGLSVWVTQMKEHNLNPQRPRGPSSSPFTTQPRHTSRSSVISEATFPRRPDATIATDLSQGQYRDIASPGSLPPLPYPSLAANSLRSPPARSNTSSSSTTITTPSSLRSLAPSFSSNVPGFFASLGRKASLSKKERPNMTPVISSPISSPIGARLPMGRKNSQPPNPAPIARPIQITAPPTIPGGPRAPPGRSKRSQTYITPAWTISQARHSVLGRRPSLTDLTLDTIIDIKADPEFSQQVDKLAALLPHANREVLAGYLRRAGTDMLAIGQYLEDERMGTIRLT